MWLPYWNLRFDPFTATPPTFVRMPAHEEAIARLVTVVEAGERFVVVRGAEGVGKSVVLHQALREIRGPSRRPVWASAPPDVESLCVSLASQLTGQPVRAGGRGGSWKALIDAVKVCHLQKVHPILILDELHAAGSDVGTETIERLSHVGSLAGRLTVWASQRDADPPDVIGGGSGAWRLSVRVTSLTYAESVRYMASKLAVAGGTEEIFTSSARDWIYNQTFGVPLGIDRLATLGLRAGAMLAVPQVTDEILEGVAMECLDGSTRAAV